ncbi:MAG: hypothetical protein ACSLFR_17815 [Solirubrobacteraceae bacterium]
MTCRTIAAAASLLIAAVAWPAAGAQASSQSLPCGAGICPTTKSAKKAAAAWARWETKSEIAERTSVEPRPVGKTPCRRLGKSKLRYRCTVKFEQGENVTWKATAKITLPRDGQCLGRYDIKATRRSPAAKDPEISHSRWRGSFGCEA